MSKKIWREDFAEDKLIIETDDTLVIAADMSGDWYVEVQKNAPTSGWTQNEAEQRAHIIAAASALLKVAEAVEWVEARRLRYDREDGEEEYTVSVCPWCQQEDWDGHAPDCIRQAAIAQARGE